MGPCTASIFFYNPTTGLATFGVSYRLRLQNF